MTKYYFGYRTERGMIWPVKYVTHDGRKVGGEFEAVQVVELSEADFYGKSLNRCVSDNEYKPVV
jgi:hypothetical protein